MSPNTTPFQQKRKLIKKSNTKEINKEKKKYYNSLRLQFLGTYKHYNSHDLKVRKKEKLKKKENTKRKKKPKETKTPPTGFKAIRQGDRNHEQLLHTHNKYPERNTPTLTYSNYNIIKFDKPPNIKC